MARKIRRIRTKKTRSTAEQVKRTAKRPERITPRSVDVSTLIPSPCVPFNLECSGRHEGAFQLGKITNLIGDSHAGKTLFALSSLAECANDKRFDDYDLFLDDVESANEFDIPYLFGKKFSKRLIDDDEYKSWTIEQFNDRIATLLDAGTPFIYVLDSFDALTSEAAIKLDAENRKKRAKGAKTDGSYGDGKAKIMSDFFKLRIQDLYDKQSSIIIISQTRDNIGFGAQFNPKVRSGGKALKFFSCHEVWLAMQKKEKKGKRTYITNVQAKITKNKITGRHGEAFFPIMFDYGVDNISSCIKFLVDEGSWTGSKASYNTKGFYPMPKNSTAKGVTHEKLVTWIEENNKEKELAELCQEAYDAVMEALKPSHRKRRY